MSFNSILEAEKEADTAVNVAKEKAKQMIAEALLKQERDIEEAKTQGEQKLKNDLIQFELSLKEVTNNENVNLEKQVSVIEESASKQADSAIKHILSKFK